MEDKNYVRLDLDKYQDLVDFKRNILNGKIVTLYETNYYSTQYYTESEIITDLTEKYNSLTKYYEKTLTELHNEKNETTKLFNELEKITTIQHTQITDSKPKELTLEDVKKMNIWQLIMWKFNN